ncbi:glycosyltransferase involved in cell wall biosynthesis [Orenia metallireducens]|uniref:glycosyltransferase family 2 protein n=1 Tax=Orenia metallireducens TaxID=1413210 RepID=UPI000D05647C|nr:glycosyltransferase family 2 protein [Orenia metallireducens]PRX31043.1 glycosyltransferase involved in cell wall biosynthesis [Orenia metallireducens]
MKDYQVELSVVAPVYNEYGNLRPLTEKIIQAIADEVESFEIIYIDDGSIDGSSELLDQLAAEYKEVRVYHFTENNGQTAAFAAAFEKAEGRLVATLDADLQVDPTDILKLLTKIEEYDLVCGVRVDREDTVIKKISSKIANGVRNWLTNEEIIDTGCPLKLFKSEVVKDYNLFEGMHRFFPTLAKMKGYSVIEVPVNHYPRHEGSSKYGISNRLWAGLKDTLAVRWMQKRQIDYQIKGEDN